MDEEQWRKTLAFAAKTAAMDSITLAKISSQYAEESFKAAKNAVELMEIYRRDFSGKKT
jgi:hypothetical protein